MVRKVLIGAVMIVALFAAPASAQYPSFVVTPGGVEVGGDAAFQGSGCQPGEEVVVTIDGNVVATVNADANGEYSGSFTVNLAPGEYTVVATCGDVVNTSPLLVRGAAEERPTPPTATPPSTGGGTLVRTGSNANTLALVGAALLVAGGGAMVVARKRFA